MAAPNPARSSRKRVALGVAQALGSLLVLALLLRDTDRAALVEVLEQAQPAWLAAALGVKVFALLLHELRLWMAFNAPRPPLAKVTAIGLAAGVLNLVLPGRAGDVAAVALLRRECGVSLGAATAAVGVASFLEAAVFGLTLGAVLLVGASQWQALLGAAAHRDALTMVTLLTLGGIAVAVLGVLIGRRLAGAEAKPSGPGPLALIRETLRQSSDSLTTPRSLALNLLLAGVDVAATVGAFALALPAVGLDVPLPWLAASGILAISSLASVVLPPTYAAGPAAASIAVLALFGVDQAGAVAYAGAWWILSQVPAALLGLPCLPGRAR